MNQQNFGEGDGFNQAATWGFQPATAGFGVAQGSSLSPEDDLDEEERERVMQVETDNEDRKRMLYDRMQEEEQKKRDRKVKGKQDLD